MSDSGLHIVVTGGHSGIGLEVNALAPYLLTQRLGGALRKAKHPVVVNTVTSNMHKSTLDLSEIIEPKRFRRLVGAYMQSRGPTTRA